MSSNLQGMFTFSRLSLEGPVQADLFATGSKQGSCWVLNCALGGFGLTCLSSSLQALPSSGVLWEGVESPETPRLLIQPWTRNQALFALAFSPRKWGE